VSWLTLDICTGLFFIVSEILPFCSFVHSSWTPPLFNHSHHNDTFFCSERSIPLLSRWISWRLKKNSTPLVPDAGDLYTLHLRYGETLNNQTALHPNLQKYNPSHVPHRKSTPSHGINRLRVKINPPHIQNKQEGGCGTLKCSSLMRVDYAVPQFVIFKKLAFDTFRRGNEKRR
jgi:hypothetical protein